MNSFCRSNEKPVWPSEKTGGPIGGVGVGITPMLALGVGIVSMLSPKFDILNRGDDKTGIQSSWSRCRWGGEATRLASSRDSWGVGGVWRLQGGSERCCVNVVIEVGVLLLLWLSLTGSWSYEVTRVV